MLLIPIEQSLIYVRPLYVQSTGPTKLPEFKFIAAAYGNRAVLADSVQGALTQLFPDLGPAPPPDGGTTPPPDGGGGVPTGDVPGLLAQAETAYNEAQTALKNGDLAAYQKAVDRVADLIRQARSASGATTTTTTAGP
jgi:uncharacterized membrane protein (UPF0182 family)